MLRSHPLIAKKTKKTETNKGRKPKPENPTWICILKYSMWLYTCKRGKKWEDGKHRSHSHLANFVLLQMLCYIFEVHQSEDSKKDNKTFFHSFPFLSFLVQMSGSATACPQIVLTFTGHQWYSEKHLWKRQ